MLRSPAARDLVYHGRRMRPIARTLLLWLPMVVAFGCSRDWDRFDPRVDAAASTTVASTGAASGGGGAATVSASSSSGQGGTAGSGGSGGAGVGGAGGAGGMPPLGPWGAPQVVAALSNPEDDDDPSLTADGLEVFFNSNRGGTGSDIWVSTRATVNDAWGTPVLVAAVNSVDSETNETVSPDGLTLFWESDRDDPGNGFKIFTATRADRNSAWSMPAEVTELNSQGCNEVSGVTSDGLLMICPDNRMMGTRTDLFALVRASTSVSWGAAVPIVELNTIEGDGEAWLHPAGTTIYLTSDRPGGAGDDDLWFATRATRSDPWGTPQNVTELNAAVHDSDATLTEDMRYIMFARAVGLSGEREIFEASR
jgi:hypothetical protein